MGETVQGPVAIIGAGRLGRGLSQALQDTGIEATLLDRTRRPEDTLRAALVLIAVSDDAIGEVAAELARGRAVGGRHVVLHLSGLLDRHALLALAVTGAALGSFHPLQSIADPSTASARLRGAFAGLEGTTAPSTPASGSPARWGCVRSGSRPARRRRIMRER